MIDDIREILRRHAALPAEVGTLAPTDDLYKAGLTSHASVNVLLALEECFNVEYPDRMLTRASFSSIATIQHNLIELLEAE
ncbi:acyl carrier protein [Streptosporangium sp. NPDC006013]|uniref:acyl carrier protein n=1 Tax=Streptosporangium sp. NPDC006013 TaxID=3155596 RepID=UPI0033BD7C85